MQEEEIKCQTQSASESEILACQNCSVTEKNINKIQCRDYIP